jgi:predicted Fe-Mo cluster-binding NifX family protein
MDSKKIKFAFAVNKSDDFESGNFCDADKFRIYELVNKDLVYINAIVNKYKLTAPEQTEGSEENGNAVIDLLHNHDINVLVSSIYGKNIQMVNSHFIPVIVSTETPDEVITALKKHIKWIKDELKNRPAEFRLFTIRKGILKTAVKRTGQNPEQINY